MPKFAAILKGGGARKRISVTGKDGVTPIECDAKLLSCADDAAIEEAAVEYARAHKVADPKPGNSQYERGLMLATLARCCLDYEVTEREEAFWKNLAEVEEHLDDGRAALLYFQQRAFQQETSPNPKNGQDPAEYLALLYEGIEAREQGDPARPFVGLPYGKLVNFSVESVRLLSSLRLLSSESGSESPAESALSSSSATPTSTVSQS
jgi:hypothetical protein